MIALALLLAILAFSCLAFATDEHHHRLTGKRLAPSARRWWRSIGWVGITIAFPVAVAGYGWITGPIAWIGVLMLAAGVVFLLLNLALRRSGSKRTAPRDARDAV